MRGKPHWLKQDYGRRLFGMPSSRRFERFCNGPSTTIELGENPAKRVVIDVKVKPAETKRSFNDAEAATVLRAALREKDPVRHWVPWLCAYTGARVSEVCQLRAQDVIEENGIWCLRFSPEAGSLRM